MTRTDLPDPATKLVVGPDGRMFPVAALWRRVLARFIDAVTVFFVQWMLVVVQVFWFMDDISDRYDPEPWGRAFSAALIYIILHGIYTLVFLRWNKGQTPAMDLMNLRAVRTSDGEHFSLHRATARWLVPGVCWFIPPVPLVGLIVNVAIYLPALWDRRRRSMVDWLAGTTVIAYDRDVEDPEEDKEQVLDEFGKPMSVRAQIRQKYGMWGGLFGPLERRRSQQRADSRTMSPKSTSRTRPRQGERRGV